MGEMGRAEPVNAAGAVISGRRQVVIVTSMHRSGTSACARVLNLRGLSIASDLMSPGPDNERGFWESRSLADYHDRFFASVDHAHDSARSLSPGVFSTAAAERLEHRLEKHLRSLPEDGPVLVKDPRISLVMPAWLKALDKVDLEPFVVVMVRNPLEVAASLDRRNRFSFERSCLLWLRYMLGAERGSRGMKRVFVSYSDFLDDWRAQTARVIEGGGLAVSGLNQQMEEECDAFLTRSLQHHREDDESIHEDARVIPWVATVYDALRRATRDDLDGLEEVLDQVERDLAASGNILEAQVARVDSRIFDFVNKEKVLQDEVLSLREQLGQQEQVSLRAEQEAKSLRDMIAASEEGRGGPGASGERDPVAFSALQEQLSEAAKVADSLKASLESERSQSVELRESIADLKSRLQSATDEDETIRLQEELRQQMDRHRQAIGIAEGELARSQQDLLEAQRKLASKDADLRISEHGREILEKRVEELRAELEQRQNDVENVTARAASTEKELKDQSVMAARLEAKVESLEGELGRALERMEGLQAEARQAVALDEQIGLMKVELTKSQSELEGSRAQSEALASELKSKQKLEADNAVFKSELSRLRAERARAAKAEKRSAQAFAKLEQDLSRLEAQREIAEQAGAGLAQERAAKQQLEASLEQVKQESHAAWTARDELSARVEQLQVELGSVRSAADQAQSRNDDLQHALQEAERVRVERDTLASDLHRAGEELAEFQSLASAMQAKAEAAQNEAADAERRAQSALSGAGAPVPPVETGLQTSEAELDAVRARADWLEDRVRSGRMPKGKFISSLMQSSAVLRVPAIMLGIYDASIARNPLRSWRVALEAEEIRRTGLFDEEFYRAQNWDVDLANEDPITHYVVHGAYEGRNPSPHFDSKAYLSANPDVAAARINPLFHFARHGRKELRPSRHVPDLLSGFRLPESPSQIVGDPYAVRPDDCVLPEAQRGAAFMERFGLQGESPDYGAAVAELNKCQRAMPIVGADEHGVVCASIVIPVYGQLAFTLNCLHSLVSQASSLACEVIVVDDCSPDETAEWLPQIDWIRYVRQTENGGFISSSNLGASHARGQYVVMLNNDTRVAPGWLDEMMNSFRIFPNAGLVGSKLFYPDGSLQEAGGIVWKDGSAWNFGRNDDPNKPEYCYARRVDYISGAAVAVPKALWDELGGFDGDYYERAYCEDADLAFQIRQRGYETWYQPLSRVIHYEGKTSGTDVKLGEKAYQVSNQARFFERWKYVLATHAENAVDPLRESDRFRPSFCLVVDATTPTPDQDAGSVTVSKILTLCSRMGVRPIFVPQDNFLYQRKYTQEILRAGAVCTYAPYQISIDHVLEVWGSLIDYAIVFRIGVAEKVYSEIRKHAPQARFIFHNIDLHYLRMQREARLSGQDDDSEQIRSVKKSEIKMIGQSDCAIVHTDVEQEILSKDCPGANIKVFNYMVDFEGTNVPFSKRHDVMFLGGYSHTPNVDAVEFFVREVWPMVRSRLPAGAKFYAVGANPPESIQRLASDDVVVTGRVDELKPYFDRARVFVAPLRYGAGIKGKVATSMSFGVPSVITNIAAEGMGLRDGEEVMVRDDPKAIADAVVQLYVEEESWSRIQDKAFDFVHRHYSMDAGQKTLEDIFESSVQHQPARAS